MKLLTGSSHESDRYVSRRWLALARAGWIVCALGLLANLVVGVDDRFLVLGGSSTVQQAIGLLITIVQWPALGAFLLTFPTGRFTPRWSWVIILLFSLWLRNSEQAVKYKE